jgi:hypothetical protein
MEFVACGFLSNRETVVVFPSSTYDQHVYTLSIGPDDTANQSEQGTADEEPSSAKDVGQTANEG